MKQRRSVAVTVVFLAAFALAVAGCNEDRLQHCVDENGQVVDPSLCEDAGTGFTHGPTGGHVYRYWYGGRTTAGGRIAGGSFEAPHGGITRGGFGTTGAGHVGEGA
jgi:hypothetical protein